MRFERIARLVVAALACAAWVGPVQAAVPSFAQVEGVLLSAGGGPAADGNYNATFSLYGQQTGGSALWTEAGTVAVKAGQFSYQLGGKTPLAAAAINGATLWLGVAVATDPELPRQAVGASLFAQRAAVADGLDCTACIKAGALDAAVLQPYAKSSDLSGYAKTSDLSGYAKSADLGNYAKTSDLGDYVKAASLAAVAASGSFNDLKDKPQLADVAKTGNYGDLTGKPAMAKLGSSCGTGLVLKGFKADGSLDCGKLDIPPDFIDEVSNGLINNQFTDKYAGGVKVPIPDGNGAGTTDTIVFPDVGIAQAVWVEVDVFNSDLSKIKIELFGPGMSTPYTLYEGSKTGQTLKALFNKDTPLAKGDLDGDWLGKNIAGNWSIIVKDPLKNQNVGTTDGDFSWAMYVKTMSSKKILVKGDLIVEGSITGQTATKGTLGSRIAHKSGKFYGWDDYTDSWRTVPGMVLPFQATGGPVQISFSSPMYAGSHRTCRALIDALPAGLYSVSDTTYKWQDGLTYTYQSGAIWRMWNPTRVYEGIPAGSHLLSFECLNDAAGQGGGSRIGHEEMVTTGHVVPYDDNANGEVKVYQVASIPNQTLGSTNQFTNVNGLSLKFVAQGGPVRVALSIPMTGGSHSSCRPLIDGVPAGKDDIDVLTYGWQEGIQYVTSQWNVWNRTRVYTKVPAGPHTLTVQCLTDSAPSYLTNSRISAHAAVWAYKPASDGNATTKVYTGVERKSYSVSNSTWTTLNGSTAGTGLNKFEFIATGGPVELGASIPLTNSSHTGCRFLVDDKPVSTGEPDNVNYSWQEGLVYVGGQWQMWDRVRMYRTIPAGKHTLGIACRGDGGSTTAGHPDMVSHLFAVAYAP